MCLYYYFCGSLNVTSNYNMVTDHCEITYALWHLTSIATKSSVEQIFRLITNKLLKHHITGFVWGESSQSTGNVEKVSMWRFHHSNNVVFKSIFNMIYILSVIHTCIKGHILEVITCPVECRLKLVIHSQTSMASPFKFENGVAATKLFWHLSNMHMIFSW